MKIKRKLLDTGFVVKVRTMKQIDELSMELNRIGYSWAMGQDLRELNYFGLTGGNRAYRVKPFGGEKEVYQASVCVYLRKGYDIFSFEEILDKNFLYEEV